MLLWRAVYSAHSAFWRQAAVDAKDWPRRITGAPVTYRAARKNKQTTVGDFDFTSYHNDCLAFVRKRNLPKHHLIIIENA